MTVEGWAVALATGMANTSTVWVKLSEQPPEVCTLSVTG